MAYGRGYFGGYADPATALADVTVLLETTDDVFVHISDDFVSASIKRGKQRDLDEFQAGTATITLRNAERQYDPVNADGPYAPNIKPNRRIQVLASWEGITYPRFYGYVNGWPQTYRGPTDSQVTIPLSDAFKIFNKAGLPPSVYAAEVAVDSPAAWWRFAEGATATFATDEISGFVLDEKGSPAFGADGLVSRDSSGSVHFAAASDGLQALLTPIAGGADSAPLTGGPMTVEFIYRVDGSPTGLIAFDCGQSDDDPTAPTGWELQIAASGLVFFEAITTAHDPTVSVESTVSVTDGDPHHIAAVWDEAGDMRMYVDGVDVSAVPANVSTGAFNPGGILVFGSSDAHVSGEVDIFPCWADEFAVYDHVLSDDRIAAHYDAYKSGGQWAGDLSGTRVNRILDLISWPEDLRDIDPGQSTLQPTDLGGQALDYLQKIAETENGGLFMTAAGVVRFVDRHTILAASGTAAAFADDGTGFAFGYNIAPTMDDTLIYNQIVVSRDGGPAKTVQDADSIHDYELSTLTRSGLLHDSDAESLGAAQYLLRRYKDPVLRVDTLPLFPTTDPDLMAALLALELLDRVSLTWTPNQTGDPIDQTTLIEGISEMIVPGDWTASLAMSPADTTVYWILGVTGHSELGDTTYLGY